jgi:hypothetical protein
MEREADESFFEHKKSKNEKDPSADLLKYATVNE